MTISVPSPPPSGSSLRSSRAPRPRTHTLPEPDSASTRGAWHRPSPSPLHLAVIAAVASLAIGLCTGCTDGDGAHGVEPVSFETPRSAIAAPLAGDGFTGPRRRS